jgi:hypothetical protein
MSAFLHILKGMTGSAVVCKQFFERFVLPSVTSPHFYFFQNQFTDIAVTIAGLYPAAAQQSVRMLVRSWSSVLPEKQAACLASLATIMRVTPADLATVTTLAPVITDSIASPSFRVSDAALEVLKTCAIKDVIGGPGAAAFRTNVRASLSDAARNHWGPEVREHFKPMLEALMQFQDRVRPERDVEAARLQRWLAVADRAAAVYGAADVKEHRREIVALCEANRAAGT